MDEKQLATLGGYIKTLSLDHHSNIPEDLATAFSTWEAKPIENAVDCLDCLNTLFSFELPTRFLVDNWKYWRIYIISIAEDKYHEALDKAMQEGNPTDLFRFLRACYRFGVSVIPDQEYDNLEALYLSIYPEANFIVKESEESFEYLTDNLKEAVRLAGFEPTVKLENPTVEVSEPTVEYAEPAVETGELAVEVQSPKLQGDELSPMNLSEKAYNILNSEKSTSIKPLRSYEEAWEFFKSSPRVKLHFSLKIDGINTKALLREDKSDVDAAVSRGRASDSFDYTEAIRRVFHVNNIDCSNLPQRITGESVVDTALLERFRQSSNEKEYKSPKSAASAMLRAPQKFKEEDYKYLHFYAFDCGELQKDEAFARLSEAGLKVPPSLIVEIEDDYLNDFSVFKSWLDDILDDLWASAMTSGIGKESTDGVVVQLLTDYESSSDDKYSSLNVALKFSHWTEQWYESEVIDILFEQKRVEMSVVLIVKPVTTRDMNIARRVSIGSPAILVDDDVKIGDVIKFSRKSEAINIYEGKK